MTTLSRSVVILLLLTGVWLLPGSVLDHKVEASDHQIRLSVSPSAPNPFSQVRVDLVSPSRILNRASITWNVMGEFSDLDENRSSVSFSTEELESEVTVTANITLQDGRRIQVSETIRPVIAGMLWESGGYTPPFYSGRSLPVESGPITVKALVAYSPEPESSENLSFLWRLDGARISAVERGRDHITIPQNRLRNRSRVGVEVKNLDGDTIARENITINTIDPELMVTEQDHNNLGPRWEKTVSEEYIMRDREVEFMVEPLFFLLPGNNKDNLSYRWSMNNERLTDKTEPSIGFQSDGSSGQANIELLVNNFIQQFARTNFRIIFGR